MRGLRRLQHQEQLPLGAAASTPSSARSAQIHDPSCNRDYTCLEGDCPSFVTITPKAGGPARRRSRAGHAADRGRRCPTGDAAAARRSPPFDGQYGIYFTGHRRHRRGHRQPHPRRRGRGRRARRRRDGPDRAVAEGGRGRLAPAPGAATAARSARPRSGAGGADLYLSGDILQAAGAAPPGEVDPGRTIAVVDRDLHARPRPCCRPTSRAPDRRRRSQQAIADRVGADRVAFVDAQRIAEAVFANHLLGQRRAARRRVPARVACRSRSRDIEQAIGRAGASADATARRSRGAAGPCTTAPPSTPRWRTPRRAPGRRRASSIRRPRPRDGGRAARSRTATLPDALRELARPARRAGGRLPGPRRWPSASSTWSSAVAARDDADHDWALTARGRRGVVQAPHLQGRVRGRPPAPARSTTAQVARELGIEGAVRGRPTTSTRRSSGAWA